MRRNPLPTFSSTREFLSVQAGSHPVIDATRLQRHFARDVLNAGDAGWRVKAGVSGVALSVRIVWIADIGWNAGILPILSDQTPRTERHQHQCRRQDPSQLPL